MNRKHKSRTSFLTMLRTALWVCAAGAAALASAQTDDQEDAYFRGGPESGRHALIITGAAASDEIRERFSQWSNSLHDVLARDYGYSADTITMLLDDGSAASHGQSLPLAVGQPGHWQWASRATGSAGPPAVWR